MQKRNKGKWIMERKIQTKLLSLVPLKRRQIHKGMSQKRKDKKLDCHYFLCLSLTSKWVFTRVHTAAWTDESKNLQKVAPTLQLSSSCEKMTGILLLLCCCCSNGTISTTSLPLLGTNRDKAAGCAAAPRHSLLVWTVVASDGEEQQQHQCSHWETPSARPRGFLLEQRATSVWDKTFNRHRYWRDNKQLIHTKPGCFRISTHTFVGFWKHRFSFFQFTYKTQLWLCRFGYLQIDSSVKFITCISHCEEEPSCLSLSSIKMTSDVLPRILNGFWHLNNTNKHVVWSPLKRFFAFQPRSCLYCRYSSSKATVMHTQWFCSRRRPEIWQKLLT